MAGISTDNPGNSHAADHPRIPGAAGATGNSGSPYRACDGTVDYDAWRRNRINIFQRWRKRETAEHCEKFSALIPAILEAIRKSAPELHKRITAGQSIEYLLSQLLKKPQWQARYFLARRWRILSGSVTRPYMRYRRYVAVIASSTRDMTSE